jgi:hypothetical protein
MGRTDYIIHRGGMTFNFIDKLTAVASPTVAAILRHVAQKIKTSSQDTQADAAKCDRHSSVKHVASRMIPARNPTVTQSIGTPRIDEIELRHNKKKEFHV